MSTEAMPEISAFRTFEVSQMAHAMAAEGRSVIHMEFGQPSTGAPQAAIDVAHAVLDREAMGYWDSHALRERLARHYRDDYGIDVAPEQFILTSGASPALLLALLVNFQPGARIAMARPGYVAYRNSVLALHQVPVEIPCGPEDRFQLTARALEAVDPAPAGVIIASPANPTGTIIARNELAAIAEVCRRRNIRIISDEIYHGLTYGEPAHSILEFEPDAWVVNSFSKYFSMVGWRLGWLLAPKDDWSRARGYMSVLYLTPPVLSQHAALVALDSRDELQGHVATYARNRELMLAALPGMGLTSIAPPDGAFYIYANVAHLTDDSLAFCKTMLRDTGVAAATGIDFDPEDGRHFVRFSFAVSTPEVEEAIRRLTPWFERLNRP